MNYTIHLDYNDAREVAYTSIRRAAIFMGLGLNAARDPELVDYSLSKEVNINLVPQNATPKTIDIYKKSFEKWIIANCFRELIEGFVVYLDRLYKHSAVISKGSKGLTPKELKTLHNKVHEKGLPGKQKLLREDFGIITPVSAHFKTIYEARNCLCHNRGLVSPNYSNKGERLEVTWRSFDIFAKTESGDEIPFSLKPNAPPTYLKEKSEVCMRFTTRSRAFHLGEVIELSVNELAEILSFAHLAADSYLKPSLEYARGQGFDVPELKERLHVHDSEKE